MKVERFSGTIGVAVSGGRDSMVLLSLYLAEGQRPVVLHVEHGIRGERSKEDAAFVKSFAEKNGLTYLMRSVDAPAYAKKTGMSEELAARELRYAFFDEALKDKTVDVIALAHHADDNAETVLMRLFRGTGLKGLCGIVDRPGYIHPILPYSRQEITDYAEKNAVPYVEDETNAESEYTRNFLRNVLLPEIKTRYPDAVDAINKMTSGVKGDYEYLCSQCLPSKKIDGGVVIQGLYLAPDSVKKYSIKSALFDLGVIKDVEKTHLDAILSLRDKENNSSVDLNQGFVAEKFDADLYLIKKNEERFIPTIFDRNKKYLFRGYGYTFVAGDKMVPGRTVDPDKVSGCVVRQREDGDLFTKVNGKTKLLSDYLNEKKLIKHQKDALLVLAKGNVVYAVLGLEVADQAKADKNYLWIRKEVFDL